MAVIGEIPNINPSQKFNDLLEYLRLLQAQDIQQKQFGQQFGLQQSQENRAKELQPFLKQQYQDIHQGRMGAENRAQQLFPFLKQQYQDIHQGRAGAESRAQSAEKRAQQLFPYYLRQFEDTHKREATKQEQDDIYNNIIKKAYEEDNEPNQTPQGQQGQEPSLKIFPDTEEHPYLPAQNANMIKKFLQENPNLPASQKNEINDFLNYSQAPANPMGQQQVNAPMTNQPQANMPTPGQQPTTMAGTNQPITEDFISKMPIGAEIVVKAGNPKLSKLDKIAGLHPAVKAPTVGYHNDMAITTYPSGKVTWQKLPTSAKTANTETPEEKSKRVVSEFEQKENIKEANKIIPEAKSLRKLHRYAEEAKSILQRNNKTTGISPGLLSKVRLARSEDTGKLTEIFGNMQAEMSKLSAARPGIGTLKWAELVKPSTWNQTEFNMGMLNSILKDTENRYQDAADDYKELKGSDLHVKLSDKNENFISMYKNGNEYHIPKDEAKEAEEKFGYSYAKK